MLAGAMMFACSVNAQETEYAPVYPNYSFKSNWSYGGAFMWTWNSIEKGNPNGPHSNPDNPNAFGFAFMAEKEVNWWLDLRLAAYIPGLITGWGDSNHFDKYGKLMLDVKIDPFDWVRGYDPDRKWNTYAYFGTGIASHSILSGEWGQLAVHIGLGASYALGEKWSAFAEYHQDFINDFPAIWKIGSWHNTNGSFLLGLMWHKGATQEDLDLIAQRALLTQENFDAKDREIEGLRSDLREAQKRENDLKNRISELEANDNGYGYGNAGSGSGSGRRIVNGGGMVSGTDNHVADSLQKIIDNYETNKHNFYALPFSILYGLDEYTVPEDQMNKINAIAQVMKDNKDVNFEIIGFCDYSGSDTYNQKLSEKRAEYVKKLLVRKGISEDRLTTSGKGKSMSFGDIKNAINRRVSFYRSNN